VSGGEESGETTQKLGLISRSLKQFASAARQGLEGRRGNLTPEWLGIRQEAPRSTRRVARGGGRDSESHVKKKRE